MGMKTTLNKFPRCIKSLFAFFKFEFLDALESTTGQL